MTSLCPCCQKPVSSSAIACSHCQTALKALGHQGIPLHRASGDLTLCATCKYHKDDSCNYPQRPFAKDCIMYVDERVPQMPEMAHQEMSTSLSGHIIQWMTQNLTLLILIGLAIISILLVLSGG